MSVEAGDLAMIHFQALQRWNNLSVHRIFDSVALSDANGDRYGLDPMAYAAAASEAVPAAAPADQCVGPAAAQAQGLAALLAPLAQAHSLPRHAAEHAVQQRQQHRPRSLAGSLDCE